MNAQFVTVDRIQDHSGPIWKAHYSALGFPEHTQQVMPEYLIVWEAGFTTVFRRMFANSYQELTAKPSPLELHVRLD